MSINDRNRDASGGRGSPKALDSTSGRTTHGSAQAASAISTWNAAAQSSGATSSQPNVGQGFTGYDSQGQAHKLARSESSVDSEESFAETVLSARAEVGVIVMFSIEVKLTSIVRRMHDLRLRSTTKLGHVVFPTFAPPHITPVET